MRALAVLATLVLGLPATPAGAQELGRLFLTPEQRAALDTRRKARVPDKPQAAVVVVESPTTRVDGVVRRSGGRSTVWLNGVPAPEGILPDGSRVQPGTAPGGVAVTIGEEERRYELRVGEKLDRDSGEVRDIVGKEAVRVRRPAEAKK